MDEGKVDSSSRDERLAAARSSSAGTGRQQVEVVHGRPSTCARNPHYMKGLRMLGNLALL